MQRNTEERDLIEKHILKEWNGYKKVIGSYAYIWKCQTLNSPDLGKIGGGGDLLTNVTKKFRHS